MAQGDRLDTVLVIDDEPVLCEFAAEVLKRNGFQVVTTTDPRKWKQACGQLVPDVAILDLFMPERDGLETMRELRDAWPSIRIVAVSGSVPVASKAALKAAAHLGADHALAKPFTEETLVGIVRQLLSAKA